MKKTIIILAIVAASVAVACSGQKDQPEGDALDISGIVLPSTIETKTGEDVTLTDKLGKIKTFDVVVFNSVTENGSFECPVHQAEGGSFTFKMNTKITSGRYICHIKRGSLDKTVGITNIKILAAIEVEPGDATVYGTVTCEGAAVAGVPVSDGVEIVTTDKNGIYRIKSDKKLKYVFITIPSGYTVPMKDILPVFHHLLEKEASIPERVDFTINKSASQDKHTVLVMGDIHLANRNNDRTEFKKFTADVNKYKDEHPGEMIYGLTLGDMTWDAYWYSNNYCFPEYLFDAKAITGIPVFHTIGNHDHDMNKEGDLLTVLEYSKDIAPDYYSFNLGKVHYIVLDNILCTNDGSGTTDSRTYKEQVTADEYAWLRKDLELVDKNTPVVVSMHAPIYRDNSSSYGITPHAGLTGWSTLVNCFTGYKTVHFLTGHTHRSLNVEKSNYFEHNAGAVCASWWWSQKSSAGFDVCTDGTPGGYLVWKVDGTNFTWQYKGTKEDLSYQFRTYDLNNVCFDASTVDSWVPSGSTWAKNRFVELYGGRFPKSTANEVLFNIWNYDSQWKIKAVEKLSSGDKELTVTQVQTYDPLHIICLSAKRLNSATVSSDPSFMSNLTSHLFKVKASSANSTIEFTVTDRFGNVYKETMTRPKTFSLANYKTGYAN